MLFWRPPEGNRVKLIFLRIGSAVVGSSLVPVAYLTAWEMTGSATTNIILKVFGKFSFPGILLLLEHAVCERYLIFEKLFFCL